MGKKIDLEIIEGNTYLTPYDPGGPVKVLKIEEGLMFGRQAVAVEFLEDHPHGYPKGDIGRYYLDELREWPGSDAEAMVKALKEVG